MSFNSTLPVDRLPIQAMELRNQFNALQAQIAALQKQLAPLVPVLSRDVAGHWTLVYAGPTKDYWQIWTRSAGNGTWSSIGKIRTNQFPSTDSVMSPGGAWWQVKICGEDVAGNQCTLFSNIVSFGAMP
jgi:hypothetical protein